MFPAHPDDELFAHLFVRCNQRLDKFTVRIEPVPVARLAIAMTRFVDEVQLVAALKRNVANGEILAP